MHTGEDSIQQKNPLYEYYVSRKSIRVQYTINS